MGCGKKTLFYMREVDIKTQMALNEGAAKIKKIEWNTKPIVGNDGGIDWEITGVKNIGVVDKVSFNPALNREPVLPANPHFKAKVVEERIGEVFMQYGEPAVITRPVTRLLPAERTLTNKQRKELKNQTRQIEGR